jgi:O-phosphoseryl-tRNA(Cys) synthetase
MTYKNEDELKKALEIDTWKNLSRDKLIKFVAMMPDMDKELALKVVEQFPEFKRFCFGCARCHREEARVHT